MKLHAFSMLALAALAGCTTVPPYDPPKTDVPAAFKEQGVWQPASGPAVAVTETWWTLFQDPVLDDLQSRLLDGNQTLKASLAQLAAARAAVASAQASVLPTVGAGLSGSRGSSGGSSATGATDGPSRVRNSVQLSADASWEIDLWGRLGLAVAGANASLQASADDLAAARLSAQATLAQAYFTLRSGEAQAAVLERTVDAYKRSLDLTQKRRTAGIVSGADVAQAEVQLANAQAQWRDALAGRAQTEHAIAVLLGLAPAAFSLPVTARLPAAPDAPELLPSTLLERRPDIAAAERRVALAQAQVGVAQKAFFPSITLSASAGYAGSSLSGLLSAPNLFWSVGPALAATLFDGGARSAAVAQAQANADQATATYRQAVLVALQEVEDNLVAAGNLRGDDALRSQALASAQRALAITESQYRAGTVGYLDVVSAQTSVLSAETTLLGVRSQRLAALSTLLKNIGGRWSPA
jgi:NodT family efflux transporter outer membrane factor (OMF) lipoprotein